MTGKAADSGSRILPIIAVSAVLWLTFLYATHKPLPLNFTNRSKMQVVDLILRILYYYPTKALAVLGHTYQLAWMRTVLSSLAWILGPKSLYDPDILIEDTEFDGVPVRVYVPKGERRSDGATIFFHGGGFVVLDVPSYESVTREMARVSQMVVVSVDYRLAPEHQFPAGIEDSERATRHFLRTAYANYSVDPAKVALMGDSAGGNIVSVVTQRLKRNPEPGLPSIAGQVLMYPVLQFVDFLTPSYQLFHAELTGTSFVDPESLAKWLLLYLSIEPHPDIVAEVLKNNHTSPAQKARLLENDMFRHHHLPEEFTDHHSYSMPPDFFGNPNVYEALEPYLFHPDFCPLCAEDLSGLPPALVVTAHYDILRDEGVWYAQRLQQAGVETEWKHYETAFHAFINFHMELEVGREALHYMMDYIITTVEKS